MSSLLLLPSRISLTTRGLFAAAFALDERRVAATGSILSPVMPIEESNNKSTVVREQEKYIFKIELDRSG